MTVNITVPELSESVQDATVAEWLKQVGDPVKTGDILVVLETDKVALEVTAEADGVLGEILHQTGADVKALEVLGTIATDGAAVSAKPAESAEPAKAEKSDKPEASTDKPEKAESGAKATPVAQRAASALNVDLKTVKASEGDRVRKQDVLAAAEKGSKPAESAPQQAAPKPAPKPAPASTSAASGDRPEERIRMTRRRQTIAARLVEAQHTAAMLTTFNEVDMSAVQEIRKRRKDAFKEKHGVSLGLSSFFVKATIGALRAFPLLNAEIQDREIVIKHYYDVGIAIGAEDGLVVPVLRNADKLSFAQIERQISDYAKQVRDGTLGIDALVGGTFTITNGGIFGSLLSTPILNPPQVGILGLHGIKDRPVVVNGEIVIRPMMYVALSYDHRIVDGREAVQFLVKLKDFIEDPESLLIEG
jgi:2-oxoglutarate dehydrogenase E2 component (dihydrolipoamide succinyltransferase)